MAEISYRRHRFPSDVIQHAVWLYLRFTLSYRDVKDLLAECGLDSHKPLSAEITCRFQPKSGASLLRFLHLLLATKAIAVAQAGQKGDPSLRTASNLANVGLGRCGSTRSEDGKAGAGPGEWGQMARGSATGLVDPRLPPDFGEAR
jgi:hypothetical protein